jgi:hypothetical protein
VRQPVSEALKRAALKCAYRSARAGMVLHSGGRPPESMLSSRYLQSADEKE